MRSESPLRIRLDDEANVVLHTAYAEKIFAFDLALSGEVDGREDLMEFLTMAEELGLSRVKVYEGYIHGKTVGEKGHIGCHAWYGRLLDINDLNLHR